MIKASTAGASSYLGYRMKSSSKRLGERIEFYQPESPNHFNRRHSPDLLPELIDTLRTHLVNHAAKFFDLLAEPFELFLRDPVVL